jgi:hypothetical protein
MLRRDALRRGAFGQRRRAVCTPLEEDESASELLRPSITIGAGLAEDDRAAFLPYGREPLNNFLRRVPGTASIYRSAARATSFGRSRQQTSTPRGAERALNTEEKIYEDTGVAPRKRWVSQKGRSGSRRTIFQTPGPRHCRVYDRIRRGGSPEAGLRKYKIKTLETQDDYHSMAEVVSAGSHGI